MSWLVRLFSLSWLRWYRSDSFGQLVPPKRLFRLKVAQRGDVVAGVGCISDVRFVYTQSMRLPTHVHKRRFAKILWALEYHVLTRLWITNFILLEWIFQRLTELLL